MSTPEQSSAPCVNIGGNTLMRLGKKLHVELLFQLTVNVSLSIILLCAECACGETYTGETKKNFAVRKAEHENKSHNSEPASQTPCKTSNSSIHMEHCVHRENHHSEENNGGPVDCLPETNPKQTSTLFY